MRAEYEAKIDQLKTGYPQVIARRMAEGLIRAGNGQRTVADLLSEIDAMPNLAPLNLEPADAPTAPAALAAPAAAPAAISVEEEEERVRGLH